MITILKNQSNGTYIIISLTNPNIYYATEEEEINNNTKIAKWKFARTLGKKRNQNNSTLDYKRHWKIHLIKYLCVMFVICWREYEEKRNEKPSKQRVNHILWEDGNKKKITNIHTRFIHFDTIETKTQIEIQNNGT